MANKIYDRFINEKIVIPFGRIIRGGILKHPRNESMIGRKGQRHYLISWLLEPKKNGSFLITGNRGSGKTSFVNHCVSKYNINLYSRLVQNEVHLKIFDYILIAFIIGFISLLITISVGLFTLKSPSVFIYAFIWPILLLPFLALVKYCLLFYKIYFEINNNSEISRTDFETLLVFKFSLLLFFSLNISSYVIANILGYSFFNYSLDKNVFYQIITALDVFLFLQVILFFLNLYIKYSKKFKSFKGFKYFKKISKSILIVLNITFIYYFLIKPNFFSINPIPEFFIHSYIIVKTGIIESKDSNILFLIFGAFICFSYLEYFYFKSQFKKNTINKKREKCKEKLVLVSQWSIPVLIIKHYIPTITISLNMGFKNLQHSNIIHAMLTDLKSKYREIFLGRNHIYNNILPVLVAFISLLLWNIISGSFIYETITHKYHNKTFIEQDVNIGEINGNKVYILKLFSNKLSSKIEKKEQKENESSILNNQNRINKIETRLSELQQLSPKPTNQNIETISLEKSLKEQDLYQKRIDLLLEKDTLENKKPKRVSDNTIKINILDIIGIFVIFIIFYTFLYYRPLTKSRKNMAKIDNLLNKLSAKVTKSNSLGNSLKKGIFEIGKTKTTSYETNPVDSRIIEIEMLELLTEIRQDKGSWFLSPGNIWTIPATSIIFIFDELDKLHNHGEDIQKTLEMDFQKNHSENEAARTYQIKRLLSDMKNFINTAPAKFIFVAGRDLHDQWLADTNSRETFLTSIFDSEIYIPSLLTDHSSADANIKSNIIKYVNVQYKKAEYQFCDKEKNDSRHRRKNQLKNYQLFFADQKNLSKTYVEKYDDKNTVKSLCDDLLVFNYSKNDQGNSLDPFSEIYKEKFVLDFIRFLTYRSQGNPKQLERSLFGFTRPNYLKISDELKGNILFERWKNLDHFCANALHFGDHEVFRIQFIAELYQQIDNKVGNYILQTDDKMAMAVFYLSDFLMKFHDTSFSWRHLIKLDELAHIHRLPDLHNVFKHMVRHFSGVYLHRVLNGIFTYRFRSDVSKEITYLSKISNVENASFNFTLDESGDLKKIFRRKIKDKKRASWDLTSGLGDLFELDGEFDDARHQYIGAIDILDKQYQIDHGNDSNNATHLIFLTPKKDNSESPLRLNVKWINERLSLMLLIGLTYEKEGRLTAAMSHYRDTKSLAKLIFKNFLGTFKEDDHYIFNNNLQHNRNEVLKHFNILYQPLFAEAWLAEKQIGGVDTSLTIAEKGVKNIRNALPFTGNIQNDYEDTSSSDVPHSNFALLASSLHNKTGDLAFFKGGQEKAEESNIGFLHKATYHYAIALHEIRRFVYHRYSTSGRKYNPHETKNINTISKTSRPDFINLTFASNLMDLGESCLAKVNISKIFNDNRIKGDIGQCDLDMTKKQLHIDFDSWAFKSNEECNKSESKIKLLNSNGQNILSCGYLQEWLGNWNQYDTNKLVTFKKPNRNLDRLIAGLLLSWVGINKMEKGGYLESASKEYVELAHASLNIVWWYLILTRFNDESSIKSKKIKIKETEKFIIKFLIEIATSCLESALDTSLKNRTSVISPKRNIDAKGSNPEFNKILPEIITTTYSAQLLIDCFENLEIKKDEYNICIDIATYTNSNDDDDDETKDLLIKHLTYNRYPMLNRLRGLSILVYHSALVECFEDIGDVTSTIINYNDTYDAPFHYTYLELGICAFISQIESEKNIKGLEDLNKNFKKDDELDILNEDIKKIDEKFDFKNKFVEICDSYKNKNGKDRNQMELKCEIEELVENRIKIEKRMQTWFQNIAFKNLKNSIGSHSMGKSYYENITKLYYLYDDFNDRRIHLNQAMQMLGTSMAEKLLKKLDL